MPANTDQQTPRRLDLCCRRLRLPLVPKPTEDCQPLFSLLRYRGVLSTMKTYPNHSLTTSSAAFATLSALEV